MVADILPAAAAAAAVAIVATPVVRMAAGRYGTERYHQRLLTHFRPAPRLGGAAIAISWVAVLAGLSALGPEALRVPLGGTPLPEILAAGTLVAVVGLWNDMRPVPPRASMFVEVLAAAIVAGAGIQIEHVTVSGSTWQLGSMAIAATVLWILAITTAFNQLDGLDSLATPLVVVATVICTAIVVSRHDMATAIVLATLLGALAGFLPYTAARAPIFLGAGGSLLSGFVLAVTAITGLQKSATALAAGALVVVFALPVAQVASRIGRADARRRHKRTIKAGPRPQ